MSVASQLAAPAPPAPTVPRRRRFDVERHPVAVAFVAAAVLHLLWWWLFADGGGDLAAQDAWAAFAREHPGSAYNMAWYGGMHPASYSPLSPYVMALLGVRTTLMVSGTLAATLAALLVARSGAVRRPLLPALYGAFALTGNTFSGRATFSLGTAIGLAALALVFAGPERWTRGTRIPRGRARGSRRALGNRHRLQPGGRPVPRRRGRGAVDRATALRRPMRSASLRSWWWRCRRGCSPSPASSRCRRPRSSCRWPSAWPASCSRPLRGARCGSDRRSMSPACSPPGSCPRRSGPTSCAWAWSSAASCWSRWRWRSSRCAGRTRAGGCAARSGSAPCWRWPSSRRRRGRSASRPATPSAPSRRRPGRSTSRLS